MLQAEKPNPSRVIKFPYFGLQSLAQFQRFRIIVSLEVGLGFLRRWPFVLGSDGEYRLWQGKDSRNVGMSR
jgi:hypothetical protein